MNVDLDDLNRVVLRFLIRKKGYPVGEAKIIHSVLLYATLRGNSQGLNKLFLEGAGGIPKWDPTADFQIFKNRVHARNGQSMIALNLAVERAMEGASESGVCGIS